MKKIILGVLALSFVNVVVAQVPQRQLTPNDTLKSIQVLPDGKVKFSIYAPKAAEVSVQGDYAPKFGADIVFSDLVIYRSHS